MEIVFVCSGNIIRSAFCDLYAKHLGLKNVSSLGTSFSNSAIHPKSARKLKELGVGESLIEGFSPTFVAQHHLPDHAIYYCMTEEHVRALVSRGISPLKVRLITSVLDREEEVLDPYFLGGYEDIFSTLKRCVETIVERFREGTLE